MIFCVDGCTSFDDPMVAVSVEFDSNPLDALHEQIPFIERRIVDQVRDHAPVTVQLLRTIPGVGKILALTNLFEIGNAHLKWASSEAAVLLLRRKAKALSIVAQKLGRTAYIIMKRRTPFAPVKFFESLQLILGRQRGQNPECNWTPWLDAHNPTGPPLRCDCDRHRRLSRHSQPIVIRLIGPSLLYR